MRMTRPASSTWHENLCLTHVCLQTVGSGAAALVVNNKDGRCNRTIRNISKLVRTFRAQNTENCHIAFCTRHEKSVPLVNAVTNHPLYLHGACCSCCSLPSTLWFLCLPKCEMLHTTRNMRPVATKDIVKSVVDQFLATVTEETGPKRFRTYTV
jgi:hypothetical protein